MTRSYCDACKRETGWLYTLEPIPNEAAKLEMAKNGYPPFAKYEICGECILKITLAVSTIKAESEAKT